MVGSPVRTCVGCRKTRPQNELIRLARLVDGSVVVDPAGSAGGRGAYVCSDERCAVKALDSGKLRRALRSDGSIEDGVRGELLELIARGHAERSGREVDG